MLRSVWFIHQRQSFAIGLSSSMAAILLLVMVALLLIILRNSSLYFWPSPIHTLSYADKAGNVTQVYARHAGDIRHAHWVSQKYNQQYLDIEIEQVHSLALSGTVAEVLLRNGQTVYAETHKLYDAEGEYSFDEFARLDAQVEALRGQIHALREDVLSPLHIKIAEFNQRQIAADAPARVSAETAFAMHQAELEHWQVQLASYRIQFVYADDSTVILPISEVEQISFPNSMRTLAKLGYAFYRFWLFVSDSPKQANSAGGVFPALFGTVLMVMLMSVMVTPLGVLTAIYLYEYAPRNMFTSLVRTCVNNLAGIPSIVFGVFGLGFLVYTLGGSIDQLFFSGDLPNPTFGSPGIFWAALTMALLTLPVVIVSTEEGLRRVPKNLREGSYALGATQAETIWHTVLPIASPGIMTGIILAVARAAGEVAPLILVGAVKFAPTLPMDGQFPYLHLDRQFMHLGVMIYDGTFQGQHMSQGANFMFAACFLLLLIVFSLNLIATLIRSKLRRRYAY